MSFIVGTLPAHGQLEVARCTVAANRIGARHADLVASGVDNWPKATARIGPTYGMAKVQDHGSAHLPNMLDLNTNCARIVQKHRKRCAVHAAFRFAVSGLIKSADINDQVARGLCSG